MKATRPKWAQKLTARQWRDLQACQFTKRPTLSRLREDVEYQERIGMKCYECRWALRTVEEASQ